MNFGLRNVQTLFGMITLAIFTWFALNAVFVLGAEFHEMCITATFQAPITEIDWDDEARSPWPIWTPKVRHSAI